MKVICILQNAWGDYKLPIIFAPNPFNKSAKIIKKICGENVFHFTNTTPVVTKAANGKSPIDIKHFKQVIKLLQPYDVILVCGRQAERAVRDHIDSVRKLNKPVFFIPHLANRTLTNSHIMYMKSILDNIVVEDGFLEYDLIAG